MLSFQMFGCCAFLPLGLLMVLMPMISAGRGIKAFVFTAIAEFVVVVLIWILNFPTLLEAVQHWQTDGLSLLPFLMLWLFPMAMGGIILYVKTVEERPRLNVCRKCGYDLRESPVRCPECGTRVREDPDRF